MIKQMFKKFFRKYKKENLNNNYPEIEVELKKAYMSGVGDILVEIKTVGYSHYLFDESMGELTKYWDKCYHRRLNK